jgi:prepilin-type N-terminal cleavage/methylation domain-containing protein
MRRIPPTADRSTASSGFTLTELMVTLTIVAALTAMSIPGFQRAIEQSRADVAVANLRAIWAAERVYWLESQVYADLPTLKGRGLLDPTFDESDTAYTYSSATSDDNFVNHFQVTATPRNGTWTGQYTIRETGSIEGEIRPPDWSQAIKPLDLQ